MGSRQVAKTRTAIGFGLVGLSGLAVNQLLFWLLTDVGAFWISWAAVLGHPGIDDLELRPQRPVRLCAGRRP